MQKTRNRSEHASNHISRSTTRRYPVSVPEAVSTDVLGVMLDEDLITRLRALESDGRAVFEAGLDGHLWEVEIAYVRREQQLRRDRRGNHERYVREAEIAFAKLEASLPAGDFDNSAYVYAATGGRPRWS